MLFAKQNPHRLSITGCVLKRGAIEERFKTKKKNLDLFILMDERSLGTEVIVIFKILSKKWWKQ